MAHCVKMMSSILILLCAIISSSLVVGWRDFMRQNACENLHVSHVQTPTPPPENVTLTLMKDGVAVPEQCYELGTMYTIELRSSGREFKGLLLRTEVTQHPGTFPEGDLPTNGKLVKDICKVGRRGWNSISHRFSRDDIQTDKNTLGDVLHFGYMSPNSPTKDPFTLRYSVVFNYSAFYENMSISFPPCSELVSTTEPTTTNNATTTEKTTTEKIDKNTTEKPSCIKNTKPAVQDNLTSNPGSDNSQVCTDFKENDEAKPVPGNCGRISNKSLDHRIYTHTNGVTYDCMIDESKSQRVKKTYCIPTCISSDGDQQCCKVGQILERKRWYTCTPHSGEQYTQLQGTNRNLSVKLVAYVQKTCVCYKCSEVTCSTPAPATTTSEETNCEESENDTNQP